MFDGCSAIAVLVSLYLLAYNIDRENHVFLGLCGAGTVSWFFLLHVLYISSLLWDGAVRYHLPSFRRFPELRFIAASKQPEHITSLYDIILAISVPIILVYIVFIGIGDGAGKVSYVLLF